jgi:hypothetical protein
MTEHPEVMLQGLVRALGGDMIVTLFLVNGQEEKAKNKDEAWLFQPELVVEAPDGAPVFPHRPAGAEASRLDPKSRAEARAMAMLYREEAEFAVGHGVSVYAERSPGDPDRAVRVRTAVVPIHEVPQQTQLGRSPERDLPLDRGAGGRADGGAPGPGIPGPAGAEDRRHQHDPALRKLPGVEPPRPCPHPGWSLGATTLGGAAVRVR